MTDHEQNIPETLKHQQSSNILGGSMNAITNIIVTLIMHEE